MEVNIGTGSSQECLLIEELDEAISRLSEQKSLHIRGLWQFRRLRMKYRKIQATFTKMQQVFVDILTKKYDNVNMDYLSMGMTNDFETAIECGANMVRIGTAILVRVRIRSFRPKT